MSCPQVPNLPRERSAACQVIGGHPRDVGGRWEQPKAGVLVGEACLGVRHMDLGKSSLHLVAEAEQLFVVRTELGLDTLPGDQGLPSEVAEAVGQPGVDVERQRRPLQLSESRHIDRDRALDDVVEESLAQRNGAVPEGPGVGLLGVPPQLVVAGDTER